MAPRKYKQKYSAQLATGKKQPCAFCQSVADDEINYGKMYVIGDITCHYFCVLLSSCLMQHGKDNQGLFGFLYEDILTEIERCKKHKCSYCQRMGANLGCSLTQCKKQFHLPCGKARDSVSLFYGNYKTFCVNHAPKQKIPDTIMIKARLRRKADQNNKGNQQNFKDLKELCDDTDNDSSAESVCVICYEYILGYPTVNSFWPPCCARDAWLHRNCLQRMALSAGMHFLKCPLCNDKDRFYQAVLNQGYYVPDRDAAWELEQNAFAEIYERQVACAANQCRCPSGRQHDADAGAWCIKLCILCGSSGVHNYCEPECDVYICVICQPAAPADIDKLTDSIEAVISQEQTTSQVTTRRGPVMPSRMSLRRTKPNPLPLPSTSSQGKTELAETSRQELNLKTPRKPLKNPSETLQSHSIDVYLSPSKWAYISPIKMIEESLKLDGRELQLNPEFVENIRIKFKKPKPLCEKKKLANDILVNMFDNLLLGNSGQADDVKRSSLKESVKKEQIQDLPTRESTPPKQEPPCFEDQDNIATSTNLLDIELEKSPLLFNTPKKRKTLDFQPDMSLEISEKNKIVNVDMIKVDTLENGDFKLDFEPTTNEFMAPNHNVLQDNHQNSLQISGNDKISDVDMFGMDNIENCDFTNDYTTANPMLLQFGPNPDVYTEKQLNFDLDKFKDQYLDEILRQTKESMLRKCENTMRKTKRKSKKNLILKFKSKSRQMNENNISIKNKHLKVKIQWKKQQLKLKISDTKKISDLNKKKDSSKLKQYILNCDKDSSNVINKPNHDITPIKKKCHIKTEKSPDNLVQTDIHRFFKVISPNKE